MHRKKNTFSPQTSIYFNIRGGGQSVLARHFQGKHRIVWTKFKNVAKSKGCLTLKGTRDFKKNT